MAPDRDATIRQAEKLLRQGKLDGAIAEYVRLTQLLPRDWTLANGLGDLYVRAGDRDRAVAQFIRAADGLFAEGFIPKASALYKKALKVFPEHEHTLLRLSEIAARQGLLADAKSYLRQVERLRARRQDPGGVAECVVRLALLPEADIDTRLAGARAAQTLGDTAQATALLRSAAEDLAEAGRQSEAIDALFDATMLNPADQELRRFLVRKCLAIGTPERARPVFTRELAGADADLLLALARMELDADREGDARAALAHLLAVAPHRAAAVSALASELARSGAHDRGFTCVEVMVDVAVKARDSRRAIDVLRAFLAHGEHIPALRALVDLAIEAGRHDVLEQSQAQLADVYLAAGRGADARAVAEELVARAPGVRVHADRLRRALVMLGVADPDRVIARTRVHVPVFDGSTDAAASPSSPVDTDAADLDDAGAAAVEAAPIVLEMVEIDLDDALSGLDGVGAAARAPVAPPRDLDDIFAEIRTRVAGTEPGGAGMEPYERGLQHLEQGRVADAVADLRAAARTPLFRFRACARLGRLCVAQGNVAEGIDWLERAAEAPAPSPDEGWAVLYDLSSALERIGESARAMAVLMEIQTDNDAYRDVRARLDRLTRAGKA